MIRRIIWTVVVVSVVLVLGMTYVSYRNPTPLDANPDLYYRAIAANPDLSQDEIVQLVAKNLHLTVEEVRKIAACNP